MDIRFENHKNGRYYRVILSRDLFGDWVVTRVWGGIGKASGRIMHVACPTHEDALNLIKTIIHARERRGYLSKDDALLSFRESQ